MRHITPFDFLIMWLAAYRLARFLVEDTLLGHWPEGVDGGSGYRKWLDAWAFDENGDDRSFVKGKIGELLQCTWCTGFWCCVGTYYAWAYGPGWLHVGVLIWSLAGAQGFLGSRMNA